MRAWTAQTTDPELIKKTCSNCPVIDAINSGQAAFQSTPLSFCEWPTYLQLQGNGEVDKFWVSDASKVKGLACTLGHNYTWVYGIHHNLQPQDACPLTTADTLAKPPPSIGFSQQLTLTNVVAQHCSSSA